MARRPFWRGHEYAFIELGWCRSGNVGYENLRAAVSREADALDGREAAQCPNPEHEYMGRRFAWRPRLLLPALPG